MKPPFTFLLEDGELLFGSSIVLAPMVFCRIPKFLDAIWCAMFVHQWSGCGSFESASTRTNLMRCRNDKSQHRQYYQALQDEGKMSLRCGIRNHLCGELTSHPLQAPCARFHPLDSLCVCHCTRIHPLQWLQQPPMPLLFAKPWSFANDVRVKYCSTMDAPQICVCPSRHSPTNGSRSRFAW